MSLTYGFTETFDRIFPAPIIAERAPTTGDTGYELGQMWIDRTADTVYILTSITGAGAQWQSGVAGSGTFTAVTATAGDITADVGDLVATGGNLVITAGTATVSSHITSTVGDITATAGNIVAGGSITAGTGFTITAGDQTLTDGDYIAQNPSAGATPPALLLQKSRTGGVITTGDDLGTINFYGHDGTSYELSARIFVDSTGTIGAGRVGSVMSFWTHPDAASAAVSRMSIASTGAVTINAPDSGVGLTITAGGQTITAGGLLVTAGDIVANSGDASIENRAASNAGANFEIQKSRAGAVITTGDDLGNIIFSGFDGTSYEVASQIKADSSGTIAAGRVASNLSFWTHPDAASASAQRMTIASTGAVTIAAPDSGVGLTITAGGETITAGNLTMTAGNVIINGAAQQLQCHGGAATDFIGQATLALGTATVLNTNIAAGDRVFLTRSSLNGSTGLGELVVTITPATSFVITSVDVSDGSTTIVADTSIVDYFIVRQV